MKLLLALALITTACGHESDTTPAYYKQIDNTIEPNKVVNHISEMPVCINQCDVLVVRGVGRFYCDGSVRWIPLTETVICQY